MENLVALVDKTSHRITNIIVVATLDDAPQWDTPTLDAVPVTSGTPYLHGTWDGKKFTPPTTEYLIELGLVSVEEPEDEA